MNELLKIVKKDPFNFLAGLAIGIGVCFIINYVYSALK